MADRRTDESSPIAPRRSLGGPAKHDEASSERPLSARVSAAISSAGSSSRSSQAPSRGRGSAPSRSGTSSGSGYAGQDAGTAVTRPRSGGTSRPRGTRKARLRLVRVDPWSVMKTAFLLSIAFGIVTVIAVGVVWSVLGAAGVWESINRTVAEVIGGETGSAFDVENYVGTSRVMGFTMIVAVVDVILITAIATLGAFLYNLSAALLGGVELTLAEDDR